MWRFRLWLAESPSEERVWQKKNLTEQFEIIKNQGGIPGTSKNTIDFLRIVLLTSIGNVEWTFYCITFSQASSDDVSKWHAPSSLVSFCHFLSPKRLASPLPFPEPQSPIIVLLSLWKVFPILRERSEWEESVFEKEKKHRGWDSCSAIKMVVVPLNMKRWREALHNVKGRGFGISKGNGSFPLCYF